MLSCSLPYCHCSCEKKLNYTGVGKESDLCTDDKHCNQGRVNGTGAPGTKVTRAHVGDGPKLHCLAHSPSGFVGKLMILLTGLQVQQCH